MTLLGTRVVRPRARHVTQRDVADCGAAALASAAACYGRRVSVASIRHAMGQSRDTASMLDLRDAGRVMGFDPRCYRVDDLTDLPPDQLPAVVHVRGDDGGHFVVVDRRVGNHVRVVDPARGVRWQAARRLPASGYLLVLGAPVGPGSVSTMSAPTARLRTAFGMVRGRIVLALGLSLVSAAVGLGTSQLLRVIVDTVLPRGDMGLLAVLTVGALVASALAGLGSVVAMRSVFEGSVTLDRSMGLGFMAHVLRMPASFFTRYSAGDVLSRFGDVASIRDAVQGGFLNLALSSVSFVGGCALMYAQSPRLLVVSLGFLTVASGALLAVGRRLRRMQWAQAALESRMSQSLVEGIEGAYAAKSVRAEHFVTGRIKGAYETLIASVRSVFIRTTALTATIGFLEFAASVTVLAIGSQEVAAGRLTLGQLLSLFVILPMMTGGLLDMIRMQPELQRALIAAERVGEIAELPGDYALGTSPGGSPPSPRQSATPSTAVERPRPARVLLEAHDLVVRRGGRPIAALDRLTVAEGAVVGLVGENGSGKTTLCRVLAGLDGEWDGIATFDGAPYGELGHDRVRERVIHVPESAFVFDDSIIGNLTLGDDVPEEIVRRAVDTSGLRPVIERMPIGIHTPVGPSGVRLSGGEGQRLAIARALVRQPAVVILDEAIRLIDAPSQRAVLGGLLPSGLVRAVVLVAHDPAILRMCTQVVELSAPASVPGGAAGASR